MPAPVENHKRSAPSSVLVPLVLAAAVLAAFWPALGAEFVAWDDDLNLTDNPRFRGFSWDHLRWMATTTRGGHWHPLTWLSWAADHRLWGMDPRGYHLTNLVLHAAAAIAFYLVARRLLRRGWAADTATTWSAAAGALVFALHPLRVESVVWISERRDVLSGVLYLLALLAYLRMVEAAGAAQRRWLGASLGCFVLSLLAKAWGITFPVVLLILDAYPLRRPARVGWRRVLGEKILYAVPAGLAAAAAFAAQRSVEDMRSLAEHPLGARLAQAAYGLCFYVWKTVVPTELGPLYLLRPALDPWAARYVLSAAVVLAVACIAWRCRRRWPWMLAAYAAYVVTVSPVLGLAQTGPQLVADRYSYLACLPWALLVAAGIRWSVARLPRAPARLTLACGCALALLVLGGATFRQSRAWHDSLTLWTHAIRLDPTNHVAFTNRGFVQPDPARALADYTAALRLAPDFYLAYFNRAEVRNAQGDHAGAVADNSAAIAILPRDPKAYNNRGWARQALGDWAGAVADYEQALALAPPDWDDRTLVEGNLARARARLETP